MATSNVIVFFVVVWAAAQVQARYTPPTFCKRPTPWSIDKIHPEFYVYTKELSDHVTLHNVSEIDGFVAKLQTDGLLAPSRPVTFLVHGFMGYVDVDPTMNTWFPEFKDALLNLEDQTIFYVIWSGGSDVFYDYEDAASNTQPVAAFLAQLSTTILNSDTFKGNKDLLYMHCIGHSLGAHVCGQAGRQSKIFDRASGLDPAGPGFEDCDDHLNIDKDSADCVDNIHTDGTHDGHWDPIVPYFGTLDAWGDVDFYPNGGGNQPGCRTNDIPPCSHERSYELYGYTIKSPPTDCMAKETCVDNDNCPQATQAMGYFSSCHKSYVLVAGNFSLVTGSADPYC